MCKCHQSIELAACDDINAVIVMLECLLGMRLVEEGRECNFSGEDEAWEDDGEEEEGKNWQWGCHYVWS